MIKIHKIIFHTDYYVHYRPTNSQIKFHVERGQQMICFTRKIESNSKV
jgi:hypothetical protein